MLHHFLRLVWIAGLTGLVALALWPYHDGALRYGLPLSAGFYVSSHRSP